MLLIKTINHRICQGRFVKSSCNMYPWPKVAGYTDRHFRTVVRSIFQSSAFLTCRCKVGDTFLQHSLDLRHAGFDPFTGDGNGGLEFLGEQRHLVLLDHPAEIIERPAFFLGGVDGQFPER
jgi:hypothetical protein